MMDKRYVLICMDKINGRFVEMNYPLITKCTKKQVIKNLEFYKDHVIKKLKEDKPNEIMIFIFGNITFSRYPFMYNFIPRVLTVSEWFKEKSHD